MLSPGDLNRNAGPDYFNARIRLDGICWAGNVEIHLKASHWKKHGHHNNPAYNNVILHVVACDDAHAFTANGIMIPALVLEADPERARQRQTPEDVPFCKNYIPDLSPSFMSGFMEKLLEEKRSLQFTRIRQLLAFNRNHWEHTFYQLLGAAFGLEINSQAFERLVRVIPFSFFRQYRDDLTGLEAMLFGRAGFLNMQQDQGFYYRELQRRYKTLGKTQPGNSLPFSIWKFLRIRPNSFPTLRIAQFARLIQLYAPLMGTMLDTSDHAELQSLLDLCASPYWENHFVFGKRSTPSEKKTGRQFASSILINAISPFFHFYGRQMNQERRCRSALELLEKTDAESNRITRVWKDSGFVPHDAGESQALLHLYKHYCKQKRCLHCLIYRKFMHFRNP